MNVELTQTYVAKKVAMRYPEFQFAQETMAKADYLNIVLNKKANQFDAEMLKSAKAAIMSRYRIKEHSAIFKNPTLRQWISDVLGSYSQLDIQNFFAERSGLGVQKISEATIGDGTLDVPFLETLIEELEFATGKVLLDDEDVFLSPLAYLDEGITYEEVANFFSAAGSDCIEERKRKANVI